MPRTCATGCGHRGLADLLPSLRDTVSVGVSAGSMVMTPESATTS